MAFLNLVSKSIVIRFQKMKGITTLKILNILSYSDWNLFWDVKIQRTQEIIMLFKLWIPKNLDCPEVF